MNILQKFDAWLDKQLQAQGSLERKLQEEQLEQKKSGKEQELQKQLEEKKLQEEQLKKEGIASVLKHVSYFHGDNAKIWKLEQIASHHTAKIWKPKTQYYVDMALIELLSWSESDKAYGLYKKHGEFAQFFNSNYVDDVSKNIRAEIKQMYEQGEFNNIMPTMNVKAQLCCLKIAEDSQKIIELVKQEGQIQVEKKVKRETEEAIKKRDKELEFIHRDYSGHHLDYYARRRRKECSLEIQEIEGSQSLYYAEYLIDRFESIVKYFKTHEQYNACFDILLASSPYRRDAYFREIVEMLPKVSPDLQQRAKPILEKSYKDHQYYAHEYVHIFKSLEMYEIAGDIHASMEETDAAFQAYITGNAIEKAIDLVKHSDSYRELMPELYLKINDVENAKCGYERLGNFPAAEKLGRQILAEKRKGTQK